MSTSKHFLAAVATACVATSSLTLAQQAQAPAPVVKSIDVQFAGPATVSKERVLNAMRTKVGKPYSVGVAEEDVRSLYQTAKVFNVRIFADPQADGTIKLVVVVQSQASVKEVNIEGASEISVRSLRKKIETKSGSELSESQVEADRQKILAAYQDKGYKDTEVKTVIKTDEKTNKANVTFVITEAQRTIIQRVRFEGNTVFSAKELRKVIKTRKHYIFSFLDKSGRVDKDLISADVDALRDFYQNHGYADVKIGDPAISRREGSSKVDVSFPIQEGPQYHVASITIGGARLFSAQELGAALRLKEGSVYSPEGIQKDVKKIQDIYGARGYIDTQVVPVSTSAGNCLYAITYRVDEGSQSYVNRVNISGNTRTKDKVIRRELALGPGDLYNSVYADASKQRLQNLNYFDRVDVFPSDTSAPGKKDVNVVVNEKRTGSLNFGAGYSTIDSVIGFVELSQSNFDITNWPNFTGGGERFRARVQAGSERKDIVVSLTEPYFLDYQLAVGGELFYRDADYLSNVYNQRNYGFDLFTRKAINQDLSWRIDYRLEEIELYKMQDWASDVMKADDGNHLKSQVGPSLVYDTRDSVFLTRRGTRADLSAYVAGGPLGGNDSIYGANLQVSHYISLPWDTILTLSGEAGSVDSWDNSDHVPIFDRLYLGGSNNLRGFKFRDVGPKDNNDEPIGGNSMARFTAEYTYPIIDRVRGALFYDMGYVNAGSYQFSPDSVASDVGVGIRLDLPIGPIRIDYGYPVQAGDATSRSGHFNFNIGYQF
ncbi:MAG: outer membrane protein assembly factor BamA [Chthoniobacteraceae bacterium]|nr:outer membrane protein assembly factor BamA [Chthoniobacteraceae bacterium]